MDYKFAKRQLSTAEYEELKGYAEQALGPLRNYPKGYPYKVPGRDQADPEPPGIGMVIDMSSVEFTMHEFVIKTVGIMGHPEVKSRDALIYTNKNLIVFWL